MDDSWSRFWERLISDWVIVAVGAFVLQGLWFGIVSLLIGRNPDLEPTLLVTSSRLGIPWLLAILAGFVWAVKRAYDARNAPANHR